MQLGDVIFYGLGAAVVVGVSGLIDFGSLFGGGKADDSGDAPTPATPQTEPHVTGLDDNPAKGAYQSTLAYFLEEEHDSLVASRGETASATPEEDDVAGGIEADPEDAPDVVPDVLPARVVAPDAPRGFEDDNIFGDVAATEEDRLYEAAEAPQPAPQEDVFDLSDPEAEAAYLDDFDGARDGIRIEYVPEVDPETGEDIVPDVAVSYDADADMTTISLDGVPVAEMDGDAGITARDVDLAPMSAPKAAEAA